MNDNPLSNAKIDLAVFVVRVVIGIRLLVAAWPAVISWQSMLEVGAFFESVHIPFPMAGAVVAVYAEFLCGIFYLLGLWTRFAGLIMVINFVVAIAYVDIHNTYAKAFPAWIILAGSFFLATYGAGGISMDRYWHNRQRGSNI